MAMPVVVAALLCAAQGCSCAKDREPASLYVLVDVSESVVRGPSQDLVRAALAEALDYTFRHRTPLIIRPVGTITPVDALVDETFQPPSSVKDNDARLNRWFEAAATRVLGRLDRLAGIAGLGSTDLAAGITEAARHIQYSDDRPTTLLIVSDLAQTAGPLDFNRYFFGGSSIDADKWKVAAVREGKEHGWAALDGVPVYVTLLSDGTSPDLSERRSEIERAWRTTLVAGFGAELRSLDADAPSLATS